MSQLRLPLDNIEQPTLNGNYLEKLVTILQGDLDFHDFKSQYASHNFHAFPAKYPPQLPRKFITELTNPGDVILDPMVGSGTTTLEACLTGRQSIGFDIDPLALMISKVKTTSLDVEKVEKIGWRILEKAREAVTGNEKEINRKLEGLWDKKTKQFVDYWFAKVTQVELFALRSEIENINDLEIRAFFSLVFSAIIITKSGGVSLALDLAHTRPHKAKIIVNSSGQEILEENPSISNSHHNRFNTKILRSPLDEFEKRFKTNIKGLIDFPTNTPKSYLSYGNAQSLPIRTSSVDLIVTSPPYASNAIDYMRAHKFSLIWLGYSIDILGQRRKDYFGGDSITGFQFENLPSKVEKVINKISFEDNKKGVVLRRYYSEMKRAMSEMYRVLKPGMAAIIVVGSSIMRGIDTETQNCFATIGSSLGFKVPYIGIRNLDRDRRMMPAGNRIDVDSQIQQRMHEEYVIGCYKTD